MNEYAPVPQSLDRADDSAAPLAGTMTERYADLGTDPVPLSVNVDPAYFELERERIFRRSWLNVGRVEDIPNPGDYFVKEIDVLQTSVLVVRGQDGVIRAFHDQCRHRGNKVVRGGSGNCKNFTCGFHGWTYDTTGKLVNVPDEDQFFKFNKAELGLNALAADVWEGFIFVNAQQQPEESLKEWIGELADEFEGWFSKDLTLIASYMVDVQCNWKVFIDAFVEAYHAPFIHGRSVGDVFTSPENPFAHLASARLYKRHRSISIWGKERPPSRAEEMAFRYGRKVWPAPGAPNEPLPRGINPEGHQKWAFDINLIFPIFQLGIANGYYLIYNYWPLAVDRSKMEFKLYMYEPKTPGEYISQEYVRTLMRDVVREDLNTMESTQSTFLGGGNTHMHLSDQEIAVRHGYKVVQRMVEGL